MRIYRLYYYTEQYDECYDYDIDIEASSIAEAILIFNQSSIVCKRVWRVEELPFRPRQ
jgi:hypothetical protein